MSDLRQSSQYAKYIQASGWKVASLDHQQVFIRSLGPLGKIIKFQRPDWPVNLNAFDQFVRKEKAIFAKFEPNLLLEHPKSENFTQELKSLGFRQDTWPLIPTKTRIINLETSEERLHQALSENAKRNLKKAHQAKLKLITGEWQEYYQNWKIAAKHRHLIIPSLEEFTSMINTFKENIAVYSCYDSNNTWLGGLVILYAFEKAYYYYATVNELGKQLQAPYLLTWESLLEAKRLGYKGYDFDGVADPRYPANNNSAWQGFTEFKSRFGGEEVTYLGSFIKYYGPGKILDWIDRIVNVLTK